MKFVSPHRNYCLVVVPSDFEYTPRGARRSVQGLRVEFENGVFDTDEAARRKGWSDDDKQVVEESLLQNGDFGRRGGFYLVGDDIESIGPPYAGRADIDTDDALASLDLMCQVVFQTPEGAVPCGNKAKQGSDYCGTHQRVAEKVAEKV